MPAELALLAEQRSALERGQLLVQQSPVSGSRLPAVEVQALLPCPPAQAHRLITSYAAIPRTIFGVDEAVVLCQASAGDTVRFSMTLPFPLGRLQWTNQVTHQIERGCYRTRWSYLSGDLKENQGQLFLAPYGDGDRSYAHYRVHVELRGRVPSSAQRLATRWLLPKVVKRLRRLATQRTAQPA